MGKSVIYGSDADLKQLELRLKNGGVKGSEAIAYLSKLVPLLRRRTNKLKGMEVFVNEVADEDRLFIAAWRVWKRKAALKGVPFWVRANGPTLKPIPDPPKEVQDPLAMVTPLKPTLR